MREIEIEEERRTRASEMVRDPSIKQIKYGNDTTLSPRGFAGFLSLRVADGRGGGGLEGGDGGNLVGKALGKRPLNGGRLSGPISYQRENNEKKGPQTNLRIVTKKGKLPDPASYISMYL